MPLPTPLAPLQSVDLAALKAAGFTTGPPRGEGGGGGGGGGAEAEERRAAQEEQRAAMLTSILEPEARERLGRVAVVKPENARAVEDHLLRAFRAGQLRERVSESLLIRLLDQVSAGPAGARGGGGGGGAAPGKVTLQRKKRVDEEDDEDDDDL